MRTLARHRALITAANAAAHANRRWAHRLGVSMESIEASFTVRCTEFERPYIGRTTMMTALREAEEVGLFLGIGEYPRRFRPWPRPWELDMLGTDIAASNLCRYAELAEYILVNMDRGEVLAVERWAARLESARRWLRSAA